ncbi:MAG: DnaJ domain-containing protein [Polyangia bacterium]
MDLPDSSLVPKKVPGDAATGSLDVMAEMFLSAVDGGSAISEIGEQLGFDEALSARIAGDLARRGLVEISGFEVEAGAGGADESERPEAPSGSNGPASTGPEEEVERLYRCSSEMNHYELLGVSPDADRRQIRSAYFDLSKRLHPDRAFGRHKGELRHKMDLVFGRISQAYEVVSSAERRAEYDEYIADQLEIWRIEKQLHSASEAARSASKEAKKPEEERKVRTRGPSRASAGSTTARKTERRVPSERPERRTIPASPRAHEERRRSWRRMRVARAFQREMGISSPGEARRSQPPGVDIENSLALASIALEQRQFSRAVGSLEEVLSVDPENRHAREMLGSARAGTRRELAVKYLGQGRYERQGGDPERALRSFEKALEVDADNAEAMYQLADLLLETRQSLPRALELAQRAATTGHKARYFATLGEILILAGENEKAAEAFRRAMKLEPRNSRHKRRMKACSKR